jgi:hypothetical protein
MSSTVLSGNFTVYYLSETRQKRIVWSGTTGTNSLRELYVALQDLFDESSQMDDGTVLSALTPTEYQIGLIDLDDDQDPWYIDSTTTEHIHGGGLTSKGWTRIQDSRTGLVKIKRSGTSIVGDDVGNTITHVDGDSGTLLSVVGEYLCIRPADNTSTNNWDSTGTANITCNGHTDSQIEAAVTGGTTFANIYTIGTIYSSTNIYIIQNGTKTTAWWSTNHIDILLRISIQGTLVDSGIITIFAREYGYLYDHYQTIMNTGGRSPVPLSSAADLNNTTLEATIAALTGITFTFGADTKDLTNGNGLRPYDVVINCGGNTIKNFYEYTKYVTRRTSTTSLNGLDGEQYIGTGEIQLDYDGQSGAFTEGQIVTSTGGVTGYITADHNNGDNTGTLVLRTVRGTFVDNEAITDPVTGAALVNGTPETLSEVKTAPFGTFAGGKFYGARGVYVYNMAGSDANNYVLTDSTNTQQTPPSTVSTTITVQDLSTASAIEGAIVLVWVTDNSNYFYKTSVSITGSGTTATVSHTAHGLTTGDFVIIEGVTNEDDYNGVYQVSVSNDNQYTYTATEILGSSPATGTSITSTFALISGTTNSIGQISDVRSLTANQSVSGWVRKSSDSPYYQQGVISGTVNTSTGLSVIIQLARDE